MSPLAQAILRQALLPPRKRSFVDKVGFLDRFYDFQCFDLSREVVVMAQHMAAVDDEAGFRAMVSDVSFLPANRTWIELPYFDDEGSGAITGRIGLLFEREGRGANLYTVCQDQALLGAVMRPLFLPLEEYGGDPYIVEYPIDTPENEVEWARDSVAEFHAMLALINSPRVTGRQQNHPHAGLQRALLRQRGPIGKYPLQAWHRVVLKVPAELQDMSDDSPREGHYTGARLEHFVRAHYRWPAGRRVHVQGHWRGDPSLGTRRSRYEVRT